MVTVILKVAEMTLLKYPTWGESFLKTIHMLTMIMNEQQTMKMTIIFCREKITEFHKANHYLLGK
jgi:hypothetical protein